MLTLHHGQGMELYWRDCYQFLTRRDQSIQENLINQKKDEINNPSSFLSSLLSHIPTEKEYQDVIVKSKVKKTIHFFNLSNFSKTNICISLFSQKLQVSSYS